MRRIHDSNETERKTKFIKSYPWQNNNNHCEHKTKNSNTQIARFFTSLQRNAINNKNTFVFFRRCARRLKSLLFAVFSSPFFPLWSITNTVLSLTSLSFLFLIFQMHKNWIGSLSNNQAKRNRGATDQPTNQTHMIHTINFNCYSCWLSQRQQRQLCRLSTSHVQYTHINTWNCSLYSIRIVTRISHDHLNWNVDEKSVFYADVLGSYECPCVLWVFFVAVYHSIKKFR